MNINFTFNKNKGQTEAGEQVLAVTSLLYLKDAILNERFEECAELISAAKGFGLTQSDIKKAIAESAQSLRLGRKNEVSQVKSSRRRF